MSAKVKAKDCFYYLFLLLLAVLLVLSIEASYYSSVEHLTGIAEVMGLNPVGTSEFSWALFVTA